MSVKLPHNRHPISHLHSIMAFVMSILMEIDLLTGLCFSWDSDSAVCTGIMHHYSDVIMGVMASQITSLMIVYSTVYSDADQRKHQSSGSLAFVWGIHQWSVNSLHKGPVTRKMFPFDDVIMGKHWSTFWEHIEVETKWHFEANIFKCIFLKKNVGISIKIPLKYVPKDPTNNISALGPIMAWCLPDNKPLSEPMMVCLLIHKCINRPHCVNNNFHHIIWIVSVALSLVTYQFMFMKINCS